MLCRLAAVHTGVADVITQIHPFHEAPLHHLKRANKHKQNTKQWYAWRNKGLGASNAPAIMGVSPWTTRFQLWAEMTGLLPRPEANRFQIAAMERGKLLEDAVRQWYARRTGLILEADVNAEHPDYEFLRASLDGWRDDDGIVREIKCPGEADHKTALSGKVPVKYIPQVQAQMMVTGAQKAEYVSFDGKDGVIVPVARDDQYIAKLLTESVAFWELVQTKTPPTPTGEDLVYMAKSFGSLTEKVNQYSKGLALVAGILAKQMTR